MKTVDDYLREVSGQLNDQRTGREFQRWNRASLLQYLNDALTEIAGYRPDAFVEDLTITLSPGYKQTVPDRQINSLNTNSDGSLINEADLDLLRAFGSAAICPQCLRVDSAGNPIFKIMSYAIDPKAPTNFYISPAVPVGLNPQVNATCTRPVPKFTLNDIGGEVPIAAKYNNAIKDYMLARAYEVDMESVQGRANSATHYQWFYNAMGVKYRMEAAFRAGNYNGAVGSGDPRSRA